jgi:hypothetical protein
MAGERDAAAGEIDRLASRVHDLRRDDGGLVALGNANHFRQPLRVHANVVCEQRHEIGVAAPDRGVARDRSPDRDGIDDLNAKPIRGIVLRLQARATRVQVVSSTVVQHDDGDSRKAGAHDTGGVAAPRRPSALVSRLIQPSTHLTGRRTLMESIRVGDTPRAKAFRFNHLFTR